VAEPHHAGLGLKILLEPEVAMLISAAPSTSYADNG
jgi:hypothetical protein